MGKLRGLLKWLRNHRFFTSIPFVYFLPMPFLMANPHIDAFRFGFYYGQLFGGYVGFGTIIWLVHRWITKKKRAKDYYKADVWLM